MVGPLTAVPVAQGVVAHQVQGYGRSHSLILTQHLWQAGGPVPGEHGLGGVHGLGYAQALGVVRVDEDYLLWLLFFIPYK